MRQGATAEEMEAAAPQITNLLDSTYDLALQSYEKVVREVLAFRPTANQAKVAGLAGGAATLLATGVYLNRRRKRKAQEAAAEQED